MVICQFFLQGRCRFGDRCWNEHPGARGAGGGRQQQPSGSNRSEGNATSQKYSSIIQPSSFFKSTPWGGSRDREKPSFNSFDSKVSTTRNTSFGLSQNPFASPSSEEQKDEKKLLLSDLKDEGNHAAPTFGFGSRALGSFRPPSFPVSNNNSATVQSFSFKTDPGIAAAPAGSSSVFGSVPAFGAVASTSSASSTSTADFGFGKPQITSAASFSFKSPAASSFGTPGFSGFPASTAAGPFGAPVAPAFGSGSSVAETLPEGEIKHSGIINLTKEMSRQLNVEAVAWLLLGAFSQIYVDNQQQRAQQGDLKCEFVQKRSTKVAVDCKHRADISIAQEEQENRKDVQRALREVAGPCPLQLQCPMFQNGSSSHTRFQNGAGIEDLFLGIRFKAFV
ncbi:nucleoporin-like protein 2 [Octodon degus]|uniref:Nucleoporin NUP42 n=1 Tax=Octodon degus TaxID=10160 RepID=A0A6P6DZX7_OCTDE|nr:nucleoporin-like protein 2 [Octodon degus]